MPEYDTSRFNPPAPLAYVTLRNPETGAVWSEAPMLLDSGADISLIPRKTVSLLQLTILPERQYELIGFDGSTSFAQAVQAELVFCRRTYRGQFLLIDQDWGILGRNVLNAVSLLFDGPRLLWTEHCPG